MFSTGTGPAVDQEALRIARASMTVHRRYQASVRSGWNGRTGPAACRQRPGARYVRRGSIKRGVPSEATKNIGERAVGPRAVEEWRRTLIAGHLPEPAARFPEVKNVPMGPMRTGSHRLLGQASTCAQFKWKAHCAEWTVRLLDDRDARLSLVASAKLFWALSRRSVQTCLQMDLWC